MDPHRLLPALLELAGRLGIEVRRAPLGGDGGGLCTLKGRKVLYLDTAADTLTQCERSLSDLAQLPEIDSAYVVPELREALDSHRGS